MSEASWLTIIGVGDNGTDSLSPEARQRVLRAETIVVSGRLAEGLSLTGKHVIRWDDGFQAGLDAILARRGQPVTILATGDPMHYGIGATLLRHLPIDEMRIFPAPSAFSLAANRLGWPLQSVDCLTLHGRPLDLLRPFLAPRRRLLALTSDGKSISEIAGLMVAEGYGASILTVLEHLGGPQEAIHRMSARDAANSGKAFADLNTLAIDCAGEAPVRGTVPGLPDDAFRHDGQLTKSEIRAASLARLRPFAGGLLWDVGAGCGSIAIEWMRAARDARAIAIEDKAARAEMIRVNTRMLGVPHLAIVEGVAPDAMAGLETPDAIFIGGGLTGEGVFDTCWQALRPGGILVANAVTLESEAALAGLYLTHGGEMSRIAVSRSAPVGRFCGWKSLMPVTIWSVTKPENKE